MGCRESIMQRLARKLSKVIRSESGTGLIEILVALVVLGTVSVAFLSGLATASKANIITDEQTTAESLARSQMEWIKNAAYAAEYSPPMPVGSDYTDYLTAITAEALYQPDDGIQKITITVSRYGKQLLVLETYKVDR